PAYRNTSQATLCRRFGISWLDLMNLWRQYKIALGMMIMANYLPQVMEDIARDALSRECARSRCDGVAQVGEAGTLGPCPACEGRGTVRVPGGTHARKLVWEVMLKGSGLR